MTVIGNTHLRPEANIRSYAGLLHNITWHEPYQSERKIHRMALAI